MTRLDDEIKKVFDDKTPEPDITKLDKYDAKLTKNKHMKFQYFLNLGLACMVVLILGLSCVLININNDNNANVTKFYGDDDIVELSVSNEFVSEYINSNLSNYSFILTDCDLIKGTAIYDKESEDVLLALSLELNKIDIPYTSITLNLILDKNYTFSKHKMYISDADIREENDEKIYTKESGESFNTTLYALIERPSYNTYLNFSTNDYEFLEKFI